jgi:hypothetical protein
MNRAGMGYLLHALAAACRARDELLVGLFLEIFEAGKPALKLMIFLAEKVIDDHGTLLGE